VIDEKEDNRFGIRWCEEQKETTFVGVEKTSFGVGLKCLKGVDRRESKNV
jgi:hypothetical protein